MFVIKLHVASRQIFEILIQDWTRTACFCKKISNFENWTKLDLA